MNCAPVRNMARNERDFRGDSKHKKPGDFTIPRHKKAARELRQSKSDDRCCLPALAGLVCLLSVVPDGTGTMRSLAPETNEFSENSGKALALPKNHSFKERR